MANLWFSPRFIPPNLSTELFVSTHCTDSSCCIALVVVRYVIENPIESLRYSVPV